MDVITQIIEYLNKTIPDIPALGSIPKKRPSAFIFVERIGGSVEDYRQLPSVLVSTWALNEKAAENMAHEVVNQMSKFKYEPNICSCECNSFVPMPDPDTNTPRYQVFYNLVTTY